MAVPNGVLATGAIAAATMGGVFFAFSTFVMRGLGAAPAPDAIRAMQAINRAAPTPLFMVPLFGTAVLAVAVGLAAPGRGGAGAALEAAGAVAYLVCVGLTVGYHVPRNDRLAGLSADAPSAPEPWAAYLREWTTANHGRTVACLVAAACWTLAIRSR